MGHKCTVCNYNGLYEPPYDDKGIASDEICPCCGFHYGYDDDDKDETIYKIWRDKWIEDGHKWFSKGRLQPNDWDYKMQMKGIKIDLPNTFPEELFNLTKSLEHLGISEVAWDWQNAIRTVEFLYGCNYMVLGGDVYKSSNGKLESTYDSWYLNKDVTKTREQLLQESKDKAISYINKYHDMYGEDFYYSLVFNKIL